VLSIDLLRRRRRLGLAIAGVAIGAVAICGAARGGIALGRGLGAPPPLAIAIPIAAVTAALAVTIASVAAAAVAALAPCAVGVAPLTRVVASPIAPRSVFAAGLTCRRRRRRVRRRLGCGRSRLAGQKLAKARPETPMSGSRRRRGWRRRGSGHHGRRGGRQQRGPGRRLGGGLLVLCQSGLGDFRRGRHEIGRLAILRQLHLVIAHPTDRVLGSLDVLVRHNEELGLALVLE